MLLFFIFSLFLSSYAFSLAYKPNLFPHTKITNLSLHLLLISLPYHFISLCHNSGQCSWKINCTSCIYILTFCCLTYTLITLLELHFQGVTETSHFSHLTIFSKLSFSLTFFAVSEDVDHTLSFDITSTDIYMRYIYIYIWHMYIYMRHFRLCCPTLLTAMSLISLLWLFKCIY